jgi:hypothetical protein
MKLNHVHKDINHRGEDAMQYWHRSSSRRSVRACAKGDRAKLERIFHSTPLRISPEGIRMAMFRRLNQVHDVSLRTEDDGRLYLTVLSDTTVPEKETKIYMQTLTDIAELVNACQVAHVLIRALENMPRDPADWPGGSFEVELGVIQV